MGRVSKAKKNRKANIKKARAVNPQVPRQLRNQSSNKQRKKVGNSVRKTAEKFFLEFIFKTSGEAYEFIKRFRSAKAHGKYRKDFCRTSERKSRE
jgi:hypothetical protein